MRAHIKDQSSLDQKNKFFFNEMKRKEKYTGT